MNRMIIFGLAVVATLFGGLGALFLKKGSQKFALSIKGVLKNKGLLLGILFYGLAMIILTITYKFEDLSYIYPLVSLSYVWVAIFSKVFLKESINKYKWTGILLIIIGIIVLNI